MHKIYQIYRENIISWVDEWREKQLKKHTVRTLPQQQRRKKFKDSVIITTLVIQTASFQFHFIFIPNISVLS